MNITQNSTLTAKTVSTIVELCAKKSSPIDTRLLEVGNFMSEIESNLVDACDIILHKCLQSTCDDKALIIFDETSIEFVDLFSDALIKNEIRGTFIYIPLKYQNFLVNSEKNLQIDGQVRLPRALEQSLADSTIVLTLLRGEPATGALRRDIVRHSRNSQARFGHIPGIDKHILNIMNISPIDKIRESCQLMAWHLGAAKHASLITQDSCGNSYRLNMEIGGWNNNPLMSTSIIEKGSWGNIPPGEAFVCPKHKLSNGELCVNGSALGRTRHDDEVILKFVDGRLVKYTNLNTNCEDEDFMKLKSVSNKHMDKNWNYLAELGIGLNPAIKELSGNPLFDEKAAGTIHIAIGDNTGFGGPISSRHHSDLVCRFATLHLDEITAIQDGCLQNASLHAFRMKHRPPKAKLQPKMRIRLLPANLDVQGDKLFRRLSSAGRFELVELFFDGDRNACMQIIDELLDANEAGTPVSLASLCNTTKVENSTLENIVSYLLFFNMAETLEK